MAVYAISVFVGGVMQNMWAPWRMEYILLKKENNGCVFCLDSFNPELTEEDEKRLVVYKGGRVFVMLNRYPYAAGHLMIIPFRHCMDITELSEEERNEFMEIISLSCKAIRRVCRPDGINMGINLGKAAGAGIADHLHAHLVPRWEGDSQFIAVVADVRLIPERLETMQKTFALAFKEIMD